MHGRHLKALGLSLLAITSVMALDAPASQAKWLLLRNSASVSSLNLSLTLSKAELLVPGLSLAINCSGGSGSASLALSAESKSLSGSTNTTFTGCKVLGAEKTCEVYGGTLQAGGIVLKAEGSAVSGGGGDVFVEQGSAGIGLIEIEGELCPFGEVWAGVAGTMRLTVLNASTNSTLHSADLDELFLSFGGEKMEMHSGAFELSHVSGSMTESGFGTWSLSTVGL